MAGDKKLQPIDLVGIGKLLEQLVREDSISCDEWDRIIQRIAMDNDLESVNLITLAGYGQSKEDVPRKSAHRTSHETLSPEHDDEYLSLTEIARVHSTDAPGYVIQSWLRSGHTLACLNLWEKVNNSDYLEEAYTELMDKKKAASFTLTPKLWISQTKAIGIVSKQGKFGGTFAHPMIACEFASWLAPEFKMLLLKLSLAKELLK